MRLRERFRRRFTPAGRLAFGALAAFGLFGADTVQSTAYQGFCFLAALLSLAAAGTMRPRVKAQARRSLPRFATVGLPLLYSMRVTNLGPRTLEGLGVHDGEAEAALPPVPPGGSGEAALETTPRRRGRLRLPTPCLLSPDPLGLVNALSPVGSEESVLVLPKRYPLPRTALPGGRRHQPGGVSLASSVGDSQEFRSLREYRPGDPLRRIHWRSWAKAGVPVVRENEDEYFVRHALVLDTFTPRPSAAFEEAVSVAASFATSVLTQESLLDLLFVGTQAVCVTAGRGLGGQDAMLEALAGVAPAREKGFSTLAAAVARRRAVLSGCVLVLLGWDEERRAFARGLEASGVPVLALAVVDPKEPPFRDAAGVRRIEAGRTAEGLALL